MIVAYYNGCKENFMEFILALKILCRVKNYDH